MVEQSTTLFPGTIFDNIAMGKDNATFEEVVHAARLVRYKPNIFNPKN